MSAKTELCDCKKGMFETAEKKCQKCLVNCETCDSDKKCMTCLPNSNRSGPLCDCNVEFYEDKTVG